MKTQTQTSEAGRQSDVLPSSASTRSGVTFSPKDSVWQFRDGMSAVSLNFALVPYQCKSLLTGLKLTLIWFLENRSPVTSKNKFHSFLRFARDLVNVKPCEIYTIASEDISNVKATSSQAEMNLSQAKSLLTKWCDLAAPGLDVGVSSFLKRLKLPQNPVGIAVATLDPEKGPLSDFEFESIQGAVNNAYASGDIKMHLVILCYLFMALGARPIQLASLKLGDLFPPENADGDYIIRVPRAKGRHHLDRSEFKFRKLTPQLGRALTKYIDCIKESFHDKSIPAVEIPIFPHFNRGENADAVGFRYHLTPTNLAERIINLFEKLKITSERLAHAISVTPIRFRRTFATRAAEEGWPLLIIAELLDHSSGRNVQIYAGLTSKVKANFSRKIAMDMAPLANAFNGKIITGESAATRPSIESRIIDLRIEPNGNAFGSCGSFAKCGFNRPVACYGGCYNFEPWLDGDHEEALDFMLAQRQRLLETTDLRIASINDRAIMGCAQVIIRCRELLNEHE